MGNPNAMDFGGLDLIVKGIRVGATAPHQEGTELSSSELSLLNGVTGNLVEVHERTFTETAGAGEYTASVTVPAGAYLIDVIIHGVAVWDNAGAVDMDVGFAGGTEIFDITSLKAGGDLLAAESISFGTGSDGGEGGTTASTNYARYSSAARTITGAITTAGAGGSTGRTRMLVVYALPSTSTAATKA
jgi:hypothetical protein